MSDLTSFGNTITGGIQDISALLPLLGTELCERNIGTALDRGIFYSASISISIFGSLGIVRASLNIIIAAINNKHFPYLGARALNNSGLGLPGSVAPIIGIDPKNPEQFLLQTKLEAMLVEEHIDNVFDLTVSWGYNFRRRSTLFVFLILFFAWSGCLPYARIISGLGTDNLKNFFPLGFGFPILRIFGSAFCVILSQFLIQVRVLALLETSLLSIRENRIGKEIESDANEEKENRVREPTKEIIVIQAVIPHIPKWVHYLLRFSLAAACISTIAGYIGCFYLIQHSASSTATLTWLVTEAGLSVSRLINWTGHWKHRRRTMITFHLQLSGHRPIITCKEYVDDITRKGVEAPVTRSDTFLADVVPYTGPLPSLDVQDVQLYYIFAALDDNAEDKRLIIVVYSLKEPEQKRMLVKREQDHDGERMFNVYICSLRPVTGTPVIMARAEKETEYNSHFLTANVDLMTKLGEHYDAIDAGIKRRVPRGSGILHRTWGLERLPPTDLILELEGEGTDSNPELDSGKGQHVFTRGEKDYLAHRALEQHRRDICRLFERWVDTQVNIYVPPTIDQSTSEDMFFLQQCDAIEKEFLRLECRRYFELALLKYCAKWDTDIGSKHGEVVADILESVEGPLHSDRIRQARLETRLTQELEFFLDQKATTRRNNMRARISAHWREDYEGISGESTDDQQVPEESYAKQFHSLMDSVNDELEPFWKRKWSAQAFDAHIWKGRDQFKQEMVLRLESSGLDHERYTNSGTIIGNYQVRADQLFDMIDAVDGDLCSLLDDPELEAPADRSWCDISAFKRMLNRVSEQWRRAQGA